MAAVPLFRPPFLFLLLFLSLPVSSGLPESDALLNLKKSFQNAHALDSWTSETEPCSVEKPWVGVVCFQKILTGLRLGNMGLTGKIDVDALLLFPGLRSISFDNNAFTGQIPDFNRLGSLKSVYLSGNQFSGKIPADFFAGMGSLKKLWLANNNFTGGIPSSLAKLSHLMELHLENNRFTGKIPAMAQSSLKSFNVSRNLLDGEIPVSLAGFDKSAFGGNPGLCGEKMGKECRSASISERASSDAKASSRNGIVPVLLVTVLVLIAAVVAVAVMARRQREADFQTLGREHGSSVSRKKEVAVAALPSSTGAQPNLGAGLVFVNGEKPAFGLTDLMKAAAEVLGSGGLGSSYKAVTGSGVAVVVKRMREMNRVGKEGFEAEMRRLGRLRHRNVLTPLAYHYRKEEKLLVFDYVPNGSLLYLLHGDRGTARVSLDWPTRLRIVRGIARGMQFLHRELTNYEAPHGNLKSGNVLLGPDYEPLLADYGFAPLVNPTVAAQSMMAYRSPEFYEFRHVSPKSDVWSLGVIILEILTGKFPTQYLNHGKGGTDVVHWARSTIAEKKDNEFFDPEISSSRSSRMEMERLLQIGAACTEPNSDLRLDLDEAVRRIEQVEDNHSEMLYPVASLRDGYGDMSVHSHTSTVRDSYGELSSRRSGLDGYGSSRRNGDSFAFDI